jgi:hypothetical protein
MMKFFYHCLLALLLLPSIGRAQVSLPVYWGIREISLKLIEACPDPDCIPIFIGRSATPVAAFLEAFYGKAPVMIPLSNFGYAPLREPPHEDLRELRVRSDTRMSSLERETFESHLYRYLKPEELSGKKIIVVDYAVSGEGLLSFTDHLGKWLSEKGVQADIRATPILLWEFIPYTLWSKKTIFNAKSKQYRVQTSEPIYSNFFTEGAFESQLFDHLAPYGHFPIIPSGEYFDGKPVEPIPDEPFEPYRKLVAQMIEYQKDSSLLSAVRILLKTKAGRSKKWFTELFCESLLRKE